MLVIELGPKLEPKLEPKKKGMKKTWSLPKTKKDEDMFDH